MEQIDEGAMPTGPVRSGSGAAIGTSNSLAEVHLAVANRSSDRLPHELVEADLLVEEVSIDGMCGVY